MPDESCPDSKRLSAYLRHELSEPESAALLQHIRQCADCRSKVALMSSFVEGPTPRDVAQGDTILPKMETDAAKREADAPQPESDSPKPAPASELSVVAEMGEYRLLEKLGEGGMGTVYKAQHTRLDKTVAVKVLTRRFRDDPRLISRFEREMKAAGRINHPNVVQAFDAREIAGTCFLVTEYIDGMNFEEIIGLHGRLPIAAACETICQAARGLQAIHEQGLVHRDIKPSNLMLTRQGVVKLLDLGLARLHDEPPEGGGMTHVGQIMGTADYMAPEQVSDCHTVDIRADIYSLGCTLFKLLTGEVLFPDSEYDGHMEKLAAQRLIAAPSVRSLRKEIPASLAAIVRRTLAKDPKERFSTPAELAKALQPFAAGANLMALCEAAASSGKAEKATDATLRNTRRGGPVRESWSARRIMLAGLFWVAVLAALGLVIAKAWRPLNDGGEEGAFAKSKESTSGGELTPRAKESANGGAAARAKNTVGEGGTPITAKSSSSGGAMPSQPKSTASVGGPSAPAKNSASTGGPAAPSKNSASSGGPIAPPKHTASITVPPAPPKSSASVPVVTAPPKNTASSGEMAVALLPQPPKVPASLPVAVLPPPSTTPVTLDATAAQKLQATYAAALGIPVAEPNSLGMSLVLIPPGTFMMGSAKLKSETTTSDQQSGEHTPHKVLISQPFLLGACGVTQDVYRKVMKVNPSHFSPQGEGWRAVVGHATDQYPVESVSWSDANEFCRRLSELPEERSAGRHYRLPTEAQWEYACRAGTAGRWNWGDQESDLVDHAWLRSNADESTHPVGGKRPNAWGLFDMHGNVYEWCSDWFSPDYYRQSPAENPSGPSTGLERVIRGGSWWNLPADARSTARVGSPADGSNLIGFRVACSVPARPAPEK